MSADPDSDNPRHMHRSRTLRLALVAAALAVAAIAVSGITGTAGATTRSETSLRAVNHQLFAAINTFRAAHQLAPLRESAALDHSAQAHSLEMGKDGYFAHSSADGTAFWQRIAHYYPSHAHRYWSVGENLLWTSPSVSAKRALAMWIASPPHLSNLLSPSWREMGISAVSVSAAPGVYGGRRVTIITNDFGARK
jgi:uncharacterized protein YkwD